ncbi:MAG: hypothetical protein K1X55_17155 [Chitinophagales bacterium]|nr:hypothetical protein [Chitinophagales bacterium]
MLLAILSSAFIFLYIHHFCIPYEDAAIMFSYAENLAHHGSISYYPGGMPTEGVSDLLLLFFVAGFLKIGVSCSMAVACISFFSAVVSTYFVRKLIRPLFLYQEILLIIIFMLLPQMIAAMVGYGTVFFGMWVLGCLYFFENKSFRMGWMMAFLGLVARPIEGFVPIAIAVVYGMAKVSDAHARRGMIMFMLFAGTFWCWRWWYFGSFMPLPFYVKTQAVKFMGVFNKETLYFLYHLMRPFIFSITLSVIGIVYLPKNWRRMPMTVFVCMILLPLFMYSCADRDMNFALRYQYLPYLGLLILVFYLWEKIPLIQWLSVLVFFVLVFRQSSDQWLRAREFNWSNMYPLASELADIVQGKGALATTEAGILPWKLQMKTMDVWGLNTPELSKRNLQMDDLEQLQPDMIIFHPYADDLQLLAQPLKDTLTKNWLQTTHVAFDFGRSQGFEVFLVPYDRRFYTQTERPWFSVLLDKRIGHPVPSARMDVFMIHPNYIYKNAIIQTIYKYGGKKYVPGN